MADPRQLIRQAAGEGLAIEFQKRFVAAHSGAFAARQDPSRSVICGRSVFEPQDTRMLALGKQNIRKPRNIYLRFCSILILAMSALAASAAGPSTPSRVTTVVRADERTGHLVRSVEVRRAAVLTPTPSTSAPAATNGPELVAMINRIAAEEGVEDSLVHSVIRAESNYNPVAVSPKGAQGIMQLIPETAARFGVTDAFNPHDNILAGVKYLKFLLDYYRNDYVRAIAAYNAGEKAVDKYKGIPPFTETRNYVYRVAQNLKAARAQRTTTQNIQTASAPAETYKHIETSVGSDGRIYYRTP